jgi:hypothetical protein
MKHRSQRSREVFGHRVVIDDEQFYPKTLKEISSVFGAHLVSHQYSF